MRTNRNVAHRCIVATVFAIGMLIGLIWFPPFGMLAGAFLGALAGEMMSGKDSSEALKPAWGVFVGTIVGVGLKFAVCGVITYYWAAAVF